MIKFLLQCCLLFSNTVFRRYKFLFDYKLHVYDAIRTHETVGIMDKPYELVI